MCDINLCGEANTVDTFTGTLRFVRAHDQVHGTRWSEFLSRSIGRIYEGGAKTKAILTESLTL